jgi:hypothetical protein
VRTPHPKIPVGHSTMDRTFPAEAPIEFCRTIGTRYDPAQRLPRQRFRPVVWAGMRGQRAGADARERRNLDSTIPDTQAGGLLHRSLRKAQNKWIEPYRFMLCSLSIRRAISGVRGSRNMLAA